MRVRLERFERLGLILKPRLGRPFTIAYGEILTAERLRLRRGLRLHTVLGSVQIYWRGEDAVAAENELRRQSVRVVDCWGAIIAPTLADFEEELAREPRRVQQSSDSA